MMGNGGGIVSGADAPVDERQLGEMAIRAYPSLELLGGATGQFLLPKSMLSAANWLVCTENRAVLAAYGVAPAHRAESLVTVVTHTRMSEPPMPHAAEHLVKGSQILADFSLCYEASPLCHGALAAALTWWHEHTPIIGGMSAEGYGHVDFALPDDEHFHAARDAYEAYLAAHRDPLRQGLMDGTLTTSKVICGKTAGGAKKGKEKKTEASPTATERGLFDAD
jgi:hypothetical protein